MAHGTCSVVVVVATIVIALTAGLVGAQTNCGQDQSVREGMAVWCSTYLQSSTMSTPDLLCCDELDYVQAVHGSPCYCQLYVTVNFTKLHVNPAKAYALPTDCNVAADMSNCTDPSTISPPGFTTPTAPTVGTPSTPASGSSDVPRVTASKSLAIPIGAAAGGLTAGVLIVGIIWFIVSRCRTSPKPYSGEPANYGDKVPVDMNGHGV